MEYWGNALEGRGLLFYDNIELQVDDDDDDGNISSPRKSVNEWNMKPLSYFDKNMLNPYPKTIDDNIEFMGSDFPQIITNSLSSDPSLGCLATEISDDSSKTVSSLLGELEFGSRVFTSVNKSSNKKSTSQTDLGLRGLADSREINNHRFSKASPISSPTPPKRARKENLCAPVYVCQVYGCNKDLSSSKDYYKRHKVCDVHSKASRVFVNGIEQRFCQQCSRFHLLAEFDDGKRSCRKRLAGHNERRRKPHVVTCSGKSSKLIQYSQEMLRFGHSKLEEPTYSRKNMAKSSTVEDESLGIISNSSRALSLLSADQWQNLSSRSSASIPMGGPLFTTRDRAHHCLHHHSSSANESYWLGTHVVPNAGVSQSMEYIKGGATVDLNQLSAHLQRVEQQKNFMLVKPQNDIFC